MTSFRSLLTCWLAQSSACVGPVAMHYDSAAQEGTHDFVAPVARLLALVAAAHGLGAQGRQAPGGRVALHRRRRQPHALLAARSDHRLELREARGGVDLARRQLRARGGRHLPIDAALCRWAALHGGRLAPHRGGHRPRERRNGLDLPRAAHHALGPRHAQQLRQGRGLRRGGRAPRDLLHLAGLLPARARRQVRRASREVGQARADSRLPQDRRRGHAARSGQGLGAVADLRLQVRPESRHPARSRQSLDLVAAHRRQRRRGRRQRARAGLLPDPHREHPRRHPGLRRRQRPPAVEVPRHPAPGRVRARQLEERCVEAHRRRLVVGADVGRSRARAGLHSDQPADHRLLRRLPPGRQPVRHQPAGARRQDRQARVALPDGPPRHLELRQPHRAGADGRIDRRAPDADRGADHQTRVRLHVQSRDRPARSGRSKSVPSPHRTCPARCCRRRSRFPPGPRRSRSRN